MKINTIYPPLFQNIVDFAKVHGMYVGTGNPNTQVLMIGKEAAISMETNEEQYKREMSNNSQDWIINIENNIQLEDVSSWFDQKPPVYNPLYPYKNQKNLVESRNEFGNIIRGNGGTSKTWHNYQQICDAIYNDGRKSALINFHENFFCSELNEMTGKYSKDVKRSERLASIQHRKYLLEQPYFQTFPITIVAVGHYVRDFNIDLESSFDVQYDLKQSEEFSKNLGKDFMNIHNGRGEQKRLLIHTNQLSMVSSELVRRLGLICREFLRL